MFTFDEQGTYQACRLRICFKSFLKQNENAVINVCDRLKY